MKKLIFTAIVPLFLVLLALPQENSAQNKKSSSTEKINKSEISGMPVQSLYSHLIEIKKVYFNRRTNIDRHGEVLEVEFEVKNKVNESQELYIFVIATYEQGQKTRSSFEDLIPEKDKLTSFSTHPPDIKNFEYTDSEGKIKYIKQPKNPKAGINVDTEKPYLLKKKLYVRALCLSKYRNNYYFFNRVMILVYNINGEPIFRQQYIIEGLRR